MGRKELDKLIREAASLSREDCGVWTIMRKKLARGDRTRIVEGLRGGVKLSNRDYFHKRYKTVTFHAESIEYKILNFKEALKIFRDFLIKTKGI